MTSAPQPSQTGGENISTTKKRKGHRHSFVMTHFLNVIIKTFFDNQGFFFTKDLRLVIHGSTQLWTWLKPFDEVSMGRKGRDMNELSKDSSAGLKCEEAIKTRGTFKPYNFLVI